MKTARHVATVDRRKLLTKRQLERVKSPALAHIVESKTEAAYRRGDLLEKRRELMATCTSFATGEAGKVVVLRSA